MRRPYGPLLIAAIIATPFMAEAQDASRSVAGGGITVAGWQGTVDPKEAAGGMKIENAKFAKEGDAFVVTTGPAVTYWNPANKATGNYTVKATFKEPKYMNVNTHAHPYGIVIGGNDMGTPNESYLYCAAYGNGNFIVRGFGPAAFAMNGPRGAAGASVNKAAAKNEPVQQEIAVIVSADKVDCSINGTVVGSYPKADLVTAGKLKSTDGIYGVRFGHNTDGQVVGLTMTKN
jgi:hypothetical protein